MHTGSCGMVVTFTLIRVSGFVMMVFEQLSGIEQHAERYAQVLNIFSCGGQDFTPLAHCDIDHVIGWCGWSHRVPAALQKTLSGLCQRKKKVLHSHLLKKHLLDITPLGYGPTPNHPGRHG